MQENSAEELPQLEAVQNNATQEDFKTKNKVYELLLYAGPQLEQFPKSQRRLADDIRGTLLQILRLVVTLENQMQTVQTRCDGVHGPAGRKSD